MMTNWEGRKVEIPVFRSAPPTELYMKCSTPALNSRINKIFPLHYFAPGSNRPEILNAVYAIDTT